MPPNSQERGEDRNASLNVSFPAHARLQEAPQAHRSGMAPASAAPQAQPWLAAAAPRDESPLARRGDGFEAAVFGHHAEIVASSRSSPSRRRRHGSPVSVPRPPAMPTLLEELDICDMADCTGAPAQVRPLLAHEVEFLCSLQRARREASWFSRAVNSVLEACDRLVVSAREERPWGWGGGGVHSPDVNPCLPGQAPPGAALVSEQNPSSSHRLPAHAG
mmetsp:Transcript_693/g.1815  ORF Transcript_693/g.1815 Transcript_693/m.1815 type:complete len:219 (+) Transcript_693:55-711(+)|eukprot:CAMPEP_0173421080 /NCGR_PEP_ID=MMETSP1357-20121228/2319_1 /TAXON_ID=77926 /ORGANISM="Hemiselmis rufescens, Strain PCC563" /LENGTH=218 /DNA_ID=CAMNT_0014383953 /DNA_START=52 /DNA_END=708 /DNA_ORIENTATION=+